MNDSSCYYYYIPVAHNWMMNHLPPGHLGNRENTQICLKNRFFPCFLAWKYIFHLRCFQPSHYTPRCKIYFHQKNLHIYQENAGVWVVSWQIVLETLFKYRILIRPAGAARTSEVRAPNSPRTSWNWTFKTLYLSYMCFYCRFE